MQYMRVKSILDNLNVVIEEDTLKDSLKSKLKLSDDNVSIRQTGNIITVDIKNASPDKIQLANELTLKYTKPNMMFVVQAVFDDEIYKKAFNTLKGKIEGMPDDYNKMSSWFSTELKMTGKVILDKLLLGQLEGFDFWG